MTLPRGARLGPYEVHARLGSGGMGEVYRAHDPRLGRDVAIKVLAPSLANDSEALGRFVREARAASALNHPHIIHIYEIGQAETASGAVRYIAMELVEGETLRARLAGGAAWRGLLEPLVQVADAVARAHKAGIVHRDLKPENVMITPDGYPKVLDFGLAKLTEGLPISDSADAPSPQVMEHTKTGLILGTPGYMSPEQVQGRPVDSRSDVFSLGCILYEVTAGQRPFKGESSVATLHAIVYEEPPPVESLNAGAPAELRHIIRKCLAKSPDQRYQTMKDLGDELRALARGSASPSSDTLPTTSYAFEQTPAKRAALTRGRLVVPAIGVAILLAALMMWRSAPPKSPERPASAPSIVVERLTNRGNADDPALSPDGRYLAYSAPGEEGRTLWLRDIAEKTERRLVSLARGEWLRKARFSNDGRSVYYFAFASKGGRHYTIPTAGGEPRLIQSENPYLSPDHKRFASFRNQDGKRVLFLEELDGGREQEIGEADSPIDWTPDSTGIVFLRGKDVFVVKNDAAPRRKIGELPERPRAARWKPDGSGVLFTIPSGGKSARFLELNVATGSTKAVGDVAWGEIHELRWLSDGSGLVLQQWTGQQAELWLVSYPDGKARRIPADTHQYWGLSLTEDGTRLAATQSAQRSELLVSSRAEKRPFKRLTSGTEVTYTLCWTPDGKIVHASNEAGSYDLYLSDADGSNRKQLTFDRKSNETSPTASPDGRYVVFVSDRTGKSGIYRIDRDGTGLKPLATPVGERGDREPQATRDGQWVLLRRWDNGPTLWKVSIDGGEPTPAIGGQTPGQGDRAWGASDSPDGNSLAFYHFTVDKKVGFSATELAVSTREGRIVRRFPLDRPRSNHGDTERVQWSPDGTRLYFLTSQGGQQKLWMQPLSGGPAVLVTDFEESLDDFDWSFDGKTLACSRSSATRDIVLITNFR